MRLVWFGYRATPEDGLRVVSSPPRARGSHGRSDPRGICPLVHPRVRGALSEDQEVTDVMALLGIENSPEHRAALRTLGNGQCLFRDLDGRTARIAVDLISQELLAWLDTNPTRQHPNIEKAAEEEAVGASGQ